jgi:hypothetical protein
MPSRLPKLPSLSVKLPGTPRGPVVEGVTQKFLRNVRAVAAWFFGPLTEWILYVDLVYKRTFAEGIDFLRQVALTAPGINTKGFNRADFVILPTGKGGGQGGVYHRGTVINPISAFTHPSRGKDLMERATLGQAGWLVIYVEDYDLERRPHEVVGLALRGVDVSTRGLGYR